MQRADLLIFVSISGLMIDVFNIAYLQKCPVKILVDVGVAAVKKCDPTCG